jgi:osmotically-inducible protein OsmY
MRGKTRMRPDSDIKRDVEEELRWDPDVDETDIGVAVKDGVVTLAGFARSFADRWQAEAAAKRVAGVVGVVNDIQIRLPLIHRRPDPQIARDAVQALQYVLPDLAERIKVIVKDGHVTLEGDVAWHYQRDRAEKAVRRVRGVTGVINAIVVAPPASAEDIKRKIEEAIRRSAELDASRITVEADGDAVILKGKVRSWAERVEAEQVAWRAPGVTRVQNRIEVEF